MSEQGLNQANVPAALEQMGRKAVTLRKKQRSQPRGDRPRRADDREIQIIPGGVE
jgi:hypothetical protein